MNLLRRVDRWGGRDRPDVPDHFIRYAVVGPRGAVNLTFMDYREIPQWPLEERVMGADFGFHSPVPQHDGHRAMEQHCELLGEVPCFYDGSSLRADQYVDLYVNEDTETIYRVLEAEYLREFEGLD